MRSRIIPTIPKRRRRSSRKPASRRRSTSISGICRCSGRTTRTAKRIGEMMQADLAKIGINAKLVTYEWGEYRKRLQQGESR